MLGIPVKYAFAVPPVLSLSTTVSDAPFKRPYFNVRTTMLPVLAARMPEMARGRVFV